MWVVESSPMRHVETPDSDAIECRPDGSSFDVFLECRLSGKLHLYVLRLEIILESKGNTVPLVMTMGYHFVANLLETSYRELLRLTFDFLHCQNINLGALKELNNPLSSGSCGVYVPGGYLHF
jgi:hypothetical protein